MCFFDLRVEPERFAAHPHDTHKLKSILHRFIFGVIEAVDHGVQLLRRDGNDPDLLAAHSLPQIDDLLLGHRILRDPDSSVLRLRIIKRAQRHRRDVGLVDECTRGIPPDGLLERWQKDSEGFLEELKSRLGADAQ